MQRMFSRAPLFDIHRRHHQELSPLPHQLIHHPRKTQIITNGKSDLSPRRIPNLLVRRRLPVIKKLNRRRLGLLEHRFPLRSHDEHRIVITPIALRILPPNRQKLAVLETPPFDFRSGFGRK